ncbi:MAG: type II toxin-antitoxin system HicB family antitoxin [Tepidiformaceae bacterium]
MDYVVIVHVAEEGGFWAEVPALPGCFTQGETMEEILVNAREAVELHVEVMAEDGLPLPEPDSIRVAKITVTAPSAA